jgi:hypothetical protein
MLSILLKKLVSHFLNICFANTESKEVPFETTGGESEE